MRTGLLAILILCASPVAAAAGPTTVHALPDPVVGAAGDEPLPGDRGHAMALRRETVEVQIAGPVARLQVRQTYQYDGSWFSPGDEAIQTIGTSHLAALHDYWITENGVVLPGIVRDRGSARAEYDANLAQRRDPGLAEWLDEGTFRLSLYPVPRQGGTKDQGFTLLQVLPVTRDRVVTLRYDLPVYKVGRTEWKLVFRDAPPREIWSNVRLAADPAAPNTFRGSLGSLALGKKQIEIRYSLDGAARESTLTWPDRSGRHFLAVTEATPDPDAPLAARFIAYLGPVEALGRQQPGATALARPRPDGRTVPDDWWTLLEGAARAMALQLDRGRSMEALDLARRLRVVAPGVVLFANPFATEEGARKGWESARALAGQADAAGTGASTGARESSGPAYQPVRPPPPESPPPAFQFELPSILPTFKAARERSNIRACFASQKTVAGAIEMYELDKNCKVLAHVFHHPGEGRSHVHSVRRRERQTPPTGVPDGVTVSWWRSLPRTVQERCSKTGCARPFGSCRTAHQALPPGPLVAQVPPGLWSQLKEGGYLQSLPQDPGQGTGSEGDYCLTTWGNGITCLIHGEIQPGAGMPSSARAQLVAEGVTDPAILAMAWNVVPHYQPRRSWYEVDGVGLCLLIWLCAAFVHFVTSLATPSRVLFDSLGHLLRRVCLWVLIALPALVTGPLVAVPLAVAIVYLGIFSGSLAVVVIKGLFQILLSEWRVTAPRLRVRQ